VKLSATGSRLISPLGRPLGLTASRVGADGGTIPISSVAALTDRHLAAAEVAQEEAVAFRLGHVPDLTCSV